MESLAQAQLFGTGAHRGSSRADSVWGVSSHQTDTRLRSGQTTAVGRLSENCLGSDRRGRLCAWGSQSVDSGAQQRGWGDLPPWWPRYNLPLPLLLYYLLSHMGPLRASESLSFSLMWHS